MVPLERMETAKTEIGFIPVAPHQPIVAIRFLIPLHIDFTENEPRRQVCCLMFIKNLLILWLLLTEHN